MTKTRKELFKKLAKEALKHRWLLIFHAKTIEEMKRICRETDCNFCSVAPAHDCGDCPLDVGNYCCNKAWTHYNDAINSNNLSEAHLNAGRIVILLREIADWEV